MKLPKIHRKFILEEVSDEESDLKYVGTHRNYRRFDEFYKFVAFKDSEGNLWGEEFLWSNEDGFVDAFWKEDADEFVELKPAEAYEIISGGYRFKK